MNTISGYINHTEKIHDARILNDVISVCRDGWEFYDHAAHQVDDQTLKTLFQGMASIRSEIVREFEPQVAVRGVEPRQSRTVAGTLQQWYTEAKSRFTSYSDHVFIAQVEKTEDRTLAVLRKAVKLVENSRLANQLASQVASVQMTHDRIKALRESAVTH